METNVLKAKKTQKRALFIDDGVKKYPIINSYIALDESCGVVGFNSDPWFAFDTFKHEGFFFNVVHGDVYEEIQLQNRWERKCGEFNGINYRYAAAFDSKGNFVKMGLLGDIVKEYKDKMGNFMKLHEADPNGDFLATEKGWRIFQEAFEAKEFFVFTKVAHKGLGLTRNAGLEKKVNPRRTLIVEYEDDEF